MLQPVRVSQVNKIALVFNEEQSARAAAGEQSNLS